MGVALSQGPAANGKLLFLGLYARQFASALSGSVRNCNVTYIMSINVQSSLPTVVCD